MVVVLVVLGLLAAAVAIVYFVVPAHSLPSFIPGHVAHETGHRTKRGTAAAIVAAVLLVAAVVVGVVGRRSASPSARSRLGS